MSTYLCLGSQQPHDEESRTARFDQMCEEAMRVNAMRIVLYYQQRVSMRSNTLNHAYETHGPSAASILEEHLLDGEPVATLEPTENTLTVLAPDDEDSDLGRIRVSQWSVAGYSSAFQKVDDAYYSSGWAERKTPILASCPTLIDALIEWPAMKYPIPYYDETHGVAKQVVFASAPTVNSLIPPGFYVPSDQFGLVMPNQDTCSELDGYAAELSLPYWFAWGDNQFDVPCGVGAVRSLAYFPPSQPIPNHWPKIAEQLNYEAESLVRGALEAQLNAIREYFSDEYAQTFRQTWAQLVRENPDATFGDVHAILGTGQDQGDSEDGQ